MKEKLFPEFSKNYFQEARERARRRKSPVNLLLIPLVFGGILIFVYLQLMFLWFVRVKIFSGNLGHANGFLNNLFHERNATGSTLLMILPVFFSSIPLAMMFANLILWCIPNVRKILDKEAEGIQFASFEVAMKSLSYIALFLVPFCLILGLIGVWNF